MRPKLPVLLLLRFPQRYMYSLKIISSARLRMLFILLTHSI